MRSLGLILWVFGSGCAWMDTQEEDGRETVTPSHPLSLIFGRSVEVQAMHVSLSAWGREESRVMAEAVFPEILENCVRYHRLGLMEQWNIQENSLEQRFVVFAAPDGAGPLVFDIQSEGGVSLQEEGATIGGLRYSRLHAWDSQKQTLPTWMETTPEGLRLVVDDSEAMGSITLLSEISVLSPT